MTCPQCLAIEDVFDQKNAEKELRSFRKKGPNKPERLLIEALLRAGVAGSTLIDIGGGIGAVQIALLEAGAAQATSVEASKGYITVSQEEINRRGFAERSNFRHGDFVELAPEIEKADIVTLVRSICCYPDFNGLVGQSAARATRLYGLVYPRDTWWMKVAFRVAEPLFQLFTRTSFRFFVHPHDEIERLLQDQGFVRNFQKISGVWQVALFGRPAAGD